MKNKFKKVISLLLSSIMVFGAAPIAALSELDFSNFSLFSFFENKANAASEDNLTFTLINNGTEYEVSACDKSVSGEVVIPSSYNGLPVTSIGDSAFFCCNDITEITIPDSVTETSHATFSECSNLTKVNYTGTIEQWCSISFASGLTNPLCNATYLYINNVLITDLVIPNSVISIGDHAFYNYKGITSVSIPNSVKSIGNWAFCGCAELTSITIPDSVISIGVSAFHDTALYNNVSNWDNGVLYIGKHLIKAKQNISKDYAIKEGTITISPYAFALCSNITNGTLPNSVVSVGELAFMSCSGLTSAYIGDALINLPYDVFSGCSSISTVTVSENNKFYSSDSAGVLYNKDKTELVCYPAGNPKTSFEIPNSVTSIAQNAFWCCSNLINIVVPDSVTSIGEYAFAMCIKLSTVILPDSILTLGFGAFMECSSLTSVTLPNGLTELSSHLFADCSALTSIIIPENVSHIKEYAFASCTSLLSVNIGKNISYIGTGVFTDCTALSNISVSDRNNYYSNDSDGVLYNKDKTELIQYPIGNKRTSFEVPNSVTLIQPNAFWFCANLTSICVSETNLYYCSDEYGVLYNKDKTVLMQYPLGNSRTSFEIPNSVTSIRYHAFHDCSSLANIIVPDSVTNIEEYAFYSCGNLKSITIPKGVVRIEGRAFDSCSSLKDVYYLGTKDEWNKISIDPQNDELINANIHFADDPLEPADPQTTEDFLTFSLIHNDTEYEVSGCDASASGEITIPSIYNGLPVTTIGNMAFEDCANISKVILPHSLKNIVYDAFWGCTRLEEFAVSDENEYFCTDSYGVLFNKDKTVLVRYPLGNDRPSYEIPYGVNELAYSSFRCCVNLSSIILPTSVTDIDSYAFPNDDILEEFYLKDVYYTGTQEQFEKIFISRANEVFWDATWHYNYKAGDAEQPIETIKPNDGSDNVLIEFPKGSFGENEAGMSLKVEDITNSSKPSKGDFKLNGHKMLALYNITPIDAAGNVIQPNGKVKVIINIFSGVKNGDNVIIIH